MNSTFLKWAGGKNWLVRNHSHLLNVEYNRYIDPFVGGGSVYFYMEPEVAIISDINSDLIITYTALRDEWQEVSGKLKEHSKKHSKDYYYYLRAMNPRKKSYKAARMIYLNRTCFNGIYRVNKKGKFNVPKGTKEHVLLSTDHFQIRSAILQNTRISVSDFEETIDEAQENDFLFCDPPYTVRHNENGFINYNEVLFSWSDQERLHDAIVRAANRGAKILLTNACHRSIIELYSEPLFDIREVSRYSSISGNASSRNQYSEVIITANY